MQECFACCLKRRRWPVSGKCLSFAMSALGVYKVFDGAECADVIGAVDILEAAPQQLFAISRELRGRAVQLCTPGGVEPEKTRTSKGSCVGW